MEPSVEGYARESRTYNVVSLELQSCSLRPTNEAMTACDYHGSDPKGQGRGQDRVQFPSEGKFCFLLTRHTTAEAEEEAPYRTKTWLQQRRDEHRIVCRTTVLVFLVGALFDHDKDLWGCSGFVLGCSKSKITLSGGIQGYDPSSYVLRLFSYQFLTRLQVSC